MSNQASLSNTTQRTRTAIARGNLVLQRYRLDACLGQGGMGEVWRGHHEDLELPVAIKFLANIEHEELMARFRREAMLMARVRDENIVRILDFGAIDERTLCIVMELLSGQNLEQWMETHRGVVPWDEARRFGVQLMHGLAAMHEEGIIHRDIKPSNVMLVDQTHQLKIVDFGIAKPTDPLERLTQTGMLIGTPAYMAPEQLLGLHATETTDIYATGLILYEMLSGTLPFGDTISAIMRRLREPTPALEAQVPCPERLCRLVMWMLEKNPERRPNTGQVIAALEALETLAPRSIDLKRPSAPPTPIQPRPKTPTSKIFSRPRNKSGEKRRSAAFLARPSTSPRQGLSRHSSNILPEPPRMFPQEHSSDPTDTPSISAHVFVVVKLAARALRQPEDQAWLGQLAAKHGVAFTIGSQFWGVLFRANAQPSATVEQIKLAIISRYGNSALIRSRLTTENLSNKSLSLDSEEPLPTALRKMMLELV